MEIERTSEGFRAVDSATNSVSVEVEGWVDDGAPPSVATTVGASDTGPDQIDTEVAGTVKTIQFPPVFLKSVATETDEHWEFGDPDDRLSLPSRSHLLRVDSTVRVFVRFDGPAALRRIDDRRISLSFPEPTPVSLCFDSLVETPEAVITVPETPDGVATALSLASARSTVTSPDRSWPTCREQPATISVGDSESLPASLVEQRPDTGIELLVPPELRYLFTSASLTYYLGADVRTEPGVEPRLRFDGHEEPLGELPQFQHRTAELLSRTFWLDCVARGAGPHGGELGVTDTFDTLGLDADRLYDAPLAERLRTYLDVPFDRVSDRFPDWHLGMYVAPTYEHVETLPHLLATVPQFFLPDSETLSKTDWIQRTMSDGFTKSRDDLPDHGNTDYRVRREVSSVDLVEPNLGPARTHGWMADDVPIDVFKTFPEAYENRLRYLDDPESTMSVVAVVNDRDMAMLAADSGDEAAMRAEHDSAVEQYQRRAEELPLDITVRENVKRTELARIFESRNDLVHYIGHRDDRGLECSDGFFDVSTLEVSNAQTFFLNACGSYPEGRELVEKGSVGGGITFEQVSDRDAATVGVAFARLLMNGFCLERALTKARRQLLTPKDYAVVGDGTHVVTQTDSIVPSDVWLFENGGEYELLVQQWSPRETGGEVTGVLDSQYSLWGARRHYEVPHGRLREYLSTLDDPVVWDSELHWSEGLSDRLSRDR